MEKIRPSAIAGSWYPGEETALREEIDRLLEKAPQTTTGTGKLRALLTPHAGYRFSGGGAAAGFKLVEGSAPRRVIIIGPSHRGRFQGLSIVNATHYETPLGKVPMDLEAIEQLRQNPLVKADPEAHKQEHCIEIQLPLLQRALKPGWKLVPILVGGMDMEGYREAAELLRPLADEETLVVISGDFTHYGPNYGYRPFPVDGNIKERLRQLDSGAFDNIAALDANGLDSYRKQTGITACAFSPAMVLLNLLPGDAVVSPISYYTSGDLLGNYQNSVSYLILSITSKEPLSTQPVRKGGSTELAPEQMQLLHELARTTLQAYVLGDTRANDRLNRLLAGIPGRLRGTAATFVTLKREGRLRGCIGSIAPVEALYRSVIGNTVKAALHDRRFQPLQSSETDNLELTVSVLSNPRPIDSYSDYEVERHGIILKKDGRQAVYLPEVAGEQGWNRAQALTQLSRKAGLPPNAWKSGARFEVFTSQTYTAPFLGTTDTALR